MYLLSRQFNGSREEPGHGKFNLLGEVCSGLCGPALGSARCRPCVCRRTLRTRPRPLADRQLQHQRLRSVPDPSCSGEPPAYPAPPNGPTGRFDEARAVAIDPFGNEYVASYAESDDAKGRIDVFDDEGHFITEVATPGPKSIAVDSKGHLYVFEDAGKVVRYPPSEYDGEAGEIKYANPPVTVASGGLGANFIGAVAVDTDGRLYVVRANDLTIYGTGEESNPVVDVVGDMGEWVEAIAVDSLRNASI